MNRTSALALLGAGCLGLLVAGTSAPAAEPLGAEPQAAEPQVAAPETAAPPIGGGHFELPPVMGPNEGAAPSEGIAKLEGVELVGNRALASQGLRSLAAPYVGRPMTAAQVEGLRQSLTRQYTDRGYINSGALIDTQTAPREGVLRFRIIEGHISEVRVRGLKGLRAAYVIHRLQGARGEVFNVNRLRERFQRLLDDPLFARLNCRILPSAKLGEAILEVDVERARPYGASAAVNNYRPPSIEEKAYSLTGIVRDLIGWGDALDASISGPIGESGGLNYSAGWQVPLNRFYTALALRSSIADSVVTEQPLEALAIKSRIERQELKLSQPLWASLTQQFNLAASAAYEKNTTSLEGIPFSFLPGSIQGVTRAVTERLAPDYSIRTPDQYLGLRLTLLHATLLDQTSSPAAFSQPDHEYLVWTGQLHYVYTIPRAHLEIEVRATDQWTHSHISDLHAVEVGGIDSVRGFRENELLVSNVHNVNLDLHWLAMPAGNPRLPGLTIGPFVDWANGHDVGEPATTFSSAGGALRLVWTHVQFDLAVGARLSHPAFVDAQRGTLQDHGVHLQLAFTL
jgi:hemolysin activation/secretion protein